MVVHYSFFMFFLVRTLLNEYSWLWRDPDAKSFSLRFSAALPGRLAGAIWVKRHERYCNCFGFVIVICWHVLPDLVPFAPLFTAVLPGQRQLQQCFD